MRTAYWETEASASTGLVSIILPTHNRAGMIGRAIASVLRQTYPHWELIVVDDASTDDTALVASRFGDPRILYVALPVNCGHPSRPRNIGWMLARGLYIAYIDDDNAWRPNHLERLVGACAAYPEAAGAYGGRCNHAPDGTTENIVDPQRTIDTGDGLHRRDLIAFMPEMWTEINFTNEDIEFWSRLRERHPVGLVWVPEVLSDYYIHDGNRYSNHWLNMRRYDTSYFQRHAARLDDPARWQAQADLIAELAPARVLDAGCGRGWTVRTLLERGISAWGADPAPALATLSLIGDRYVRASADCLPFPDGAFDSVLCADVLAHIPEPFVMRSLRELLRVCGGVLVAAINCSDPTGEGHLTIRPRDWWHDQFIAAGAEPACDLESVLGRKLGDLDLCIYRSRSMPLLSESTAADTCARTLEPAR